MAADTTAIATGMGKRDDAIGAVGVSRRQQRPLDLDPRVANIASAAANLLRGNAREAPNRCRRAAGTTFHRARSRTVAIASATVPPSNAGRPVAFQRMQLKARMSVRLSTAWPRACSGLM
jgi:hypothetical protein